MTYYRYDDLRAGKVEKWVAQPQHEIMPGPPARTLSQFDNHSKIAITYSYSPLSLYVIGLDASMNPSTTFIDLSFMRHPKYTDDPWITTLNWQLSPGKYLG